MLMLNVGIVVDAVDIDVVTDVVVDVVVVVGVVVIVVITYARVPGIQMKQ